MKVEQIGKYLNIENDDYIVNISEEEITVDIKELNKTFYINKNKETNFNVDLNKDYTLEDLKQKLINNLMDKLNENKILNEMDVDLIKILFN